MHQEADTSVGTLIVEPFGGMCNRLRVLASAVRASEKTGRRCVVVWSWPSLLDLFVWDLPVFPTLALALATLQIESIHRYDDNHVKERRVSLNAGSHIFIKSCHAFGVDTEIVSASELIPFYPALHHTLERAVSNFTHTNFTSTMMGVHIRRTDNGRAKARSTDSAFIAAINARLNGQTKIFLASDDASVEKHFQTVFPGKIVIYPKRSTQPFRWPLRPTITDLEDALIDLHLLSRCSHLIGSYDSTYTQAAISIGSSLNPDFSHSIAGVE